MQDEELLIKWREGDRGAGEELFRRHFDALFRFFCSKANAVAEDLTQETLLACVRGKERIREEGRFRAYMFATARRRLQAFYEKHNKSREVDFGSQSVADFGPGASSVLAKKADDRLLLEGLRQLPLDYQIALELHHFENMSGSQIAEVLGVPEGTIRSRLRRARMQLREHLEALSASPDALKSTLTRLDQWAEQVRAGAPGDSAPDEPA